MDDPELNPICHLLALAGAHHILHVSRIRVNWFCEEVLEAFFYLIDNSHVLIGEFGKIMNIS